MFFVFTLANFTLLSILYVNSVEQMEIQHTYSETYVLVRGARLQELQIE